MLTYKDILNDSDILQKYEQIEIETNYVIAHGIVHVKNVLALCKNIAQAFNLSKNNARLLYIACALHDIGRFIDNKTHNLTSEKFAREYTATYTNLFYNKKTPDWEFFCLFKSIVIFG